MARIILSIFFLIVFTVLIILNLDNRTAFNVFGFNFADLPTTAVALVSFVLGVLYSFIYYLFSYFGKMKKENIQKKKKKLTERETSLKEREQIADEKREARGKIPEQDDEAASVTSGRSPSRSGLLSRLKNRKKT